MEDKKRFKHTMPVQIRFSDVDQFGHVNNSVYFALYDLAKTTYVKDVLGDSVDWRRMGIVVANINANFLLPVFFDDKIKIETATVHLGNKSFTLLQRAVTEDTGEVKCECKTVMVMFDLKEKQPMQIPDEFKAIIRNYENNSFLM